MLAVHFGASPVVPARPLLRLSSILAFHLASFARSWDIPPSAITERFHRIPTVVILPQMLYLCTNAVCRTQTGAKVVQHSTNFCRGKVCILDERFKLILDFCKVFAFGWSCRHRASMIYPPGLPSVCVLLRLPWLRKA